MGEEGRQGDLWAPGNFQVSSPWWGQGEEICPPLSALRERGQWDCCSSTTVKKSWLGLLGSGEGWSIGAASQTWLLSCCVFLGRSCTLSGSQFPRLSLTSF